MANGVSFAALSGNITRDPELVSEKLLTFSVAVNRREKNSDGEYADAAHFFDVKVLGNRAKPLAGILAKGRGVTIVGDLVQERWEKDGQKRSTVRVLAREVVPHCGESSGDAPAGDDTKPEGGKPIPF